MKKQSRGGPGMAGGEMMRQAARLQRKLETRRKELKDHEVSHKGLGDRIEVTVTCEGRVRRIEVDPEFVASEGLELTLDAVVATINSALEAADKLAQSEYDKVTGGLRIPGMS